MDIGMYFRFLYFTGVTWLRPHHVYHEVGAYVEYEEGHPFIQNIYILIYDAYGVQTLQFTANLIIKYPRYNVEAL